MRRPDQSAQPPHFGVDRDASDVPGRSWAECLSQLVTELLGREPTVIEWARVERLLARLTRRTAEEARGDAQAVRAQSRQVRRHLAAARVARSDARSVPMLQESNMEYVARLHAAAKQQGAAALGDLVPEAAEWRSLGVAAECQRTTAERFWNSPEIAGSTPLMFRVQGDDVVLLCEARLADRPPQPLWLAFRFQGKRLIRCAAYENKADLERELSQPAGV